MSSQAPVPSPTPKKKKKKISTGHVEELPPSMSLSQINAQYKFGKVTNISFGNIFGHVFEHVIGIQAVAQQYLAAKKHSCFIVFEQEIPIIHYGSGSNASYLQLDHNHCIISILFIHYESPLTHSELYNIALCKCSFLSHTCIKKNFFANCTNLTNLSFLYLSTGCQMTCLKYIFSDNGTDITTNSALTTLLDHWEQHFTEPLFWKELTDKPFKSIMWAIFVFLSMFIQAVSAFEVAIITNIIQWEDKFPMSNNDFGLLSSGLSDGLWDNIFFNSPVLKPSIIKLKNYIMTRMVQQAKKTNKGKSATNDKTSGEE
eukprot:m51a1_g11695 hypothetical protein (315) ;mRNA; r:10631-12336